jgi:MFS family permease
MSMSKSAVRVRTACVGFAVFGGFWGVWGASVPTIRAQAELGDSQLGTALLFVGAGALPAMLVAGRAVDRWGHRVTAALLVALGAAGVAVAATARDFWSLSAGLAVLGASSGAADVAINAAAGSAERAAGRPVVIRAHGFFSAGVVLASLSTGLLAGLGAPVIAPFLLLSAILAGAALVVMADGRDALAMSGADGRAVPAVSEMDGRAVPVASDAEEVTRFAPRGFGVRPLPLLVIGGLGALAFAVENAHQSWGAVYLSDMLDAGPVLASAGPAVFAAIVALTRFAAGSVGSRRATPLLVIGAVTAVAGTLVVAIADVVPVALLGLALAAAGTAVLFPTLISLVTAHVEDEARGRATSIVTTVAYLGFLAGPVYVGRWAEATGLSGAMVAVAALAAVLAILAWPALRLVVRPGSSWASAPGGLDRSEKASSP